MKIVATRVIPYQRNLPRPIVTSHGTYLNREGFLLIIKDERGHVGVGDAAPLEGLSTDTLVECEHALLKLTRMAGESIWDTPNSHVTHYLSSTEFRAEHTFAKRYGRPLIQTMEHWVWDMPENFSPSSPAAFFAAATALGELKSKRQGLSLARAMCPESSHWIPVNGLVTEESAEDVARQAISLEERGFTSFKIKVGLDNPGDDIARICAVCDATPNALLRLDANGGWDVRWADNVLSNIPRRCVDFIEQPFPRGQWLAARELAARHHVRLALDEDVRTLDEADALIRHRVCDVLVLKPMVIGRLYQCVLLAERARESGIEVIYTSSWESDIGIATTIHLAAALGPNPPAMGLSTAGMISADITTKPLQIENGHLRVPEGPGLGVELVPEILEQLQ